MYNDTITLFNAHNDDSKAMHWYPSVLRNVNLNMDRASIVAKFGAESQDKVVLNVRYHLRDGKKMVGDKIWLPPKEWKRQAVDSLTGSLTFASGQEFDFFYVGEWPDAELISENAYPDGFYNHMNKQYDFVFAITADSCYSVIPHFEIMGR